MENLNVETVCRHLIRHAVAWLPEHERSCFCEEWEAHLDETDGAVGKINHALGCTLGVFWLARALGERPGATAQAAKPEEKVISRRLLTIGMVLGMLAGMVGTEFVFGIAPWLMGAGVSIGVSIVLSFCLNMISLAFEVAFMIRLLRRFPVASDTTSRRQVSRQRSPPG